MSHETLAGWMVTEFDPTTCTERTWLLEEAPTLVLLDRIAGIELLIEAREHDADHAEEARAIAVELERPDRQTMPVEIKFAHSVADDAAEDFEDWS